MHLVTTRRRYKGRVYETHLRRRTFRQGGAHDVMVGTTLGVDLGPTQLHTDAWTRRWTGSSRAQPAIEATLVRRHLAEGSLLGYDLSSSFVEGAHNELAAFGHSRDGKRAKRQVEYGVVATREGLPVTIEVFPGNTSDPKGLFSMNRGA
jgi:transposase